MKSKVFMITLLCTALLIVITNFNALGEKDVIGTIAPSFTVKNLIDEKLITLSDLRGKVVIIDFWATWCPPCRKEIPHFIELYNEYPRTKLEIIGISLDRGTNEEAIKNFIISNKINYPIAMLTADIHANYKQHLVYIPTTFVIDPKGKVAAKFIGYRDKSVFVNEIKKYIK